MFGAYVFAFLMSLVSLALLIIDTFSTPFIKQLYFLHTNEADGVSFGVFGWCVDNGAQCSPKQLGIDWKPQLISWMTQALILFPIAAGITVFSLGSLTLVLCSTRRYRYYDITPAMSTSAFFCVIAFITSLAAAAFAIVLYLIALERFHHDGFHANLGPAIWIAIGAAASSAMAAITTGCGCVCGGRYSRVSPYLPYSV